MYWPENNFGTWQHLQQHTVHTATAECSSLHEPNKKRRFMLTVLRDNYFMDLTLSDRLAKVAPSELKIAFVPLIIFKKVFFILHC
jgi:hypothetical protein